MWHLNRHKKALEGWRGNCLWCEAGSYREAIFGIWCFLRMASLPGGRSRDKLSNVLTAIRRRSTMVIKPTNRTINYLLDKNCVYRQLYQGLNHGLKSFYIYRMFYLNYLKEKMNTVFIPCKKLFLQSTGQNVWSISITVGHFWIAAGQCPMSGG